MIASNGSQLGAFEWDGSALRVIGVNTGTVPASGEANWPINPGDIHHVGPIQSAHSDSIMIFNSNLPGIGPQMGILRWDGSTNGFVVDWTGNGTLSANGQSWTVGEDNGIARADVDGDGLLELVVQSDSTSALGYLKWLNGSLSPIWVCAAVSGANPPPLGWGVGIIANAPPPPFSWPTSDQQKIYQQTSLSLTQYLSKTDDIRSYYSNNQIQQNLASYAADISTALSELTQTPPSYYWQWMSQYQMNDLNAVLSTLETKFQAVPDIWTFNTNMRISSCKDRQTVD